MLQLKLALRSMLSLPVVRETASHYVIILSALAYFTIIFFVLKTFQYNKDKSEN